MTRAEALKLRSIVEQAIISLDDKTASEAAPLFPRLKKNGLLILAGTRINWNGTIKRAAVDLWDTVENNPDNAPNFWEDIQYRNGYRIIPEIITAGMAFAQDEIGWWGDKLYCSKIPANVYTPITYPDGWELIQDAQLV